MELQIKMLGGKPSLQNSAKSLLTTVNLGYDLKPEPIVVPETPDYIQAGNISSNENSIKSSIETGFNDLGYIPYPEHDDKPVIEKQPIFDNKDSIIESIETGFDKENIITVECHEPKQYIALYKENYLGEFKTDVEKQLARDNLGVLGKSEVSNIVSDIVNNSTLSFITRQEVEEMVLDLDFVNSISRSYVNYEIPNNLFKL